MLEIAAPANAVWHSNAATGEAMRGMAARGKEVRGKGLKRLPDFIAPQLATLVEVPPSGDDWAHEVKFDGYRLQLRVGEGRATLLTRKGLDWTDKFPAIAAEGAGLPDCVIVTGTDITVAGGL